MKEIVIPQNLESWCKTTLQAGAELIQRIEPLRVEASHRTFYRVHTDLRTIILMDSPPQLERNDQFCRLTELFSAHQIPVGEILGHATDRGFFLLQDLGHTHLEDLYGSPQEDLALAAAVSLLPRLGAVTGTAIEPYTTERFAMELSIFEEWFLDALLNTSLSLDANGPICAALLSSIKEQPQCCVHRDYHCRNLLFTDGHLGVVDFQDALHGPVMYDIASLLRDCYYEFPESIIQRWFNHFLQQTPSLHGVPSSTTQLWFDWTAIHRQLKAIGIFARLHLRDDKSSHLPFVMPLLNRVMALAGEYPSLAPLSELLAECAAVAPARLAHARNLHYSQ